MSIETDAERDLALNPEDAENVVGGKKKTAKKKAVQHAATHNLVFNATPLGAESADAADKVAFVDPNADPDC